MKILLFIVSVLRFTSAGRIPENQQEYKLGVGRRFTTPPSLYIPPEDSIANNVNSGFIGLSSSGSASSVATGEIFTSSSSSFNVVEGESGFLDYTSGSSLNSNVKVYKPIIKRGEPLITKSFFIHRAPEEEIKKIDFEEKEHIVRPRKHYNIVFVKAPASGSNSIHNNHVNIYPENEEKTIIYVLTGKNDEVDVNENGEIQVPEPRPPSKPEVIFVKYKNEADAERAIEDIHRKHDDEEDASVSFIGANTFNTASSSASSSSSASTSLSATSSFNTLNTENAVLNNNHGNSGVLEPELQYFYMPPSSVESNTNTLETKDHVPNTYAGSNSNSQSSAFSSATAFASAGTQNFNFPNSDTGPNINAFNTLSSASSSASTGTQDHFVPNSDIRINSNSESSASSSALAGNQDYFNPNNDRDANTNVYKKTVSQASSSASASSSSTTFTEEFGKIGHNANLEESQPVTEISGIPQTAWLK